jgi:DNA-binding NarL/FixJ family response regulator
LVNALNKDNHLRALVVDDSAAVRTSLSALLDAHPSLEVVGTADNGRDAVAKVEALSPDLVVMDLQMPEMNGLDATRNIRQRHPAVQVIVITMHDSGGIRAACRLAGAHGFVSKMAGIHEILDEIRRVFDRSSQSKGDE